MPHLGVGQPLEFFVLLRMNSKVNLISKLYLGLNAKGNSRLSARLGFSQRLRLAFKAKLDIDCNP